MRTNNPKICTFRKLPAIRYSSSCGLANCPHYRLSVQTLPELSFPRRSRRFLEVQETEEPQRPNAVDIAVMSLLHEANAFFEDDGASGR